MLHSRMRRFERDAVCLLSGQQDDGALLCPASVFTVHLLTCCDVHCRKTCGNFTEPLAASNNISKDTFKYMEHHTVSLCSQESQPGTLMLHSGHTGKMGEKSFTFTDIIHISSQLVNSI